MISTLGADADRSSLEGFPMVGRLISAFRNFRRWHEGRAQMCELIVVASMLMTVVGCGKEGGTFPVAGRALLTDGTALPAGRIMLIGGETGPSGQIQPDGSFRLGTFTMTDGARPGRYKVVIVGAAVLDARPYEEQLRNPEHTPPSLIHPKYNRGETSDLNVDIAEGQNELLFKLEPNPRPNKSPAVNLR